MIIDDIFSKISAHMIKGLMTHEQLANYYCFLGYDGYSNCHNEHYKDESEAFRALNRYYLKHHNKLINEERVENPNVIPSSWYGYLRSDVDVSTRIKALKDGIDIWIDWEKETVELYSEMYRELCDISEFVDAEYIKNLMLDAKMEYTNAVQLKLCLESVDYDLDYIMCNQPEI